MTQLIKLYNPNRYCKHDHCGRVDCEDHCWSCGTEHSYARTETHFCPPCEIKMENEDLGIGDDDNLDGLWNPPTQPAAGRVLTNAPYRREPPMALSDMLRAMGDDFFDD